MFAHVTTRTVFALHEIATIIFIGVNLLALVKTDATNEPEVTTSNPSPVQKPNIKEADLEPLPIHIARSRLGQILSPDIFSQSDPLAFLIPKVAKIPYQTVFEVLDYQIKYYLRTEEFPQHYIPYVELVSLLLPCVKRLVQTGWSIREIQNAPKLGKSISIPLEISTSELYQVFSPDIFSDRYAPSVLFDKLIHLPVNQLTTVKNELQNFLNEHGSCQQEYCRYARHLNEFLQNVDDEELIGLRLRNSEMQSSLKLDLSGSNFQF